MAPPKRITREGVLEKVRAAYTGGAPPSMDEMAALAGVSRAALYALFGTRAALVEAIGAELPPAPEDRILAAAGELIAERGYSGLSLDEVAQRSGVSRATVYRLYPGKTALFKEVSSAQLSIDEALSMMETVEDRPPAEVLPAVARGLVQDGSVPMGVLRSILFEVARGEDTEFLDQAYERTKVIVAYFERQMEAGRLRRMDPVLAMQEFLAPLMLHAVSRPTLARYGMLHVSLEEAAAEVTSAFLRAMAPARRPRAGEKTPPPGRVKARRPAR